MTITLLNTPIILTLVRLIVSPLLLPLLLVYFLPLNSQYINFGLAFFFVLLSLTDFFDGYLARKYAQETILGKILDPIADKFLIYATLIGLLASNKIHFYWVVLLIGREFFVMALRQVSAQYNISCDVIYLAKIKTAFQMVLLTFLIVMPLHSKNIWWNVTEISLLCSTIYLSLYTAGIYYRQCIQKLIN